MLALFAAEYVLGNRLLSSNRQPGWVKPSHVGVAAGLGALFTVNTVTGLRPRAARHKNPAFVSMGVSTVGTAMMRLWRK